MSFDSYFGSDFATPFLIETANRHLSLLENTIGFAQLDNPGSLKVILIDFCVRTPKK